MDDPNADLIAALTRHTAAVERLVDINQGLLGALVSHQDEPDDEPATYMDGTPIDA